MLAATAIVFLQYTSAFFALIAAIFWLLSARVHLPASIQTIDAGYFGDTQPKPVDDLDRLTAGLARQSKLSALAAIAAAISALLQGLIAAL